jgi:hypothetical protein
MPLFETADGKVCPGAKQVVPSKSSSSGVGRALALDPTQQELRKVVELIRIELTTS